MFKWAIQTKSEMKSKIALLLALGLSACANTGPVQIAKDTYSISARVPFSGPAGARGDALKEANSFCAAQNKQVLLQSDESKECALHGGCGEVEIIFMCLEENDPRYSTSR
jgi:hypothetical protein